MAAADRVQVVIGGRTYRLAGGDPEHTRRLARKVDEVMSRFSGSIVGADDYQVAILTALHIADELSAAEDNYRSYRSRVEGLVGQVQGVLEEDLAEEDLEKAGAVELPPTDLQSALSPSDSEAEALHPCRASDSSVVEVAEALEDFLVALRQAGFALGQIRRFEPALESRFLELVAPVVGGQELGVHLEGILG